MLKASLWVVIVLLTGAIAWLLLSGGEPSESPAPPAPVQEPAVETPSSGPPAPPETASKEQLEFRNLVLSGSYAKPGPTENNDPNWYDVLCLKNGAKHKGRLISQDDKVVVFQVLGTEQPLRCPKEDVVRVEQGSTRPRPMPSRSNPPPGAQAEGPGIGPDGQKSELYMTASEWQAAQRKKDRDRVDAYKKKGGIRAINMAREVHENAEKGGDQPGTEDAGK